jgi:hypothetical protein
MVVQVEEVDIIILLDLAVPVMDLVDQVTTPPDLVLLKAIMVVLGDHDAYSAGAIGGGGGGASVAGTKCSGPW